MATKYHQGYYTPNNPSKYIGNVNNIRFRSSWEYSLFKYLDNHSHVIAWGSEECVIPYLSPVDGKMHRYFVDMIVKLRDSEGKIRKYLVEVKPHSQTMEPPRPKRITEGYKQKVFTYLVNKAKWEAATKFAKKIDAEFLILTERELFGRTK